MRMRARAPMASVSVRLWTSGGERSLICYESCPAGPPYAGERQGVTADNSDGCPEFCRQLGQLDTLTTGTCFSLHTNLLKDNSNGGSRTISKL